MTGAQNLISVVELRRLLIELNEKRPDICIRFRLLGELWSVNFYSIITVNQKGALFRDEVSNNYIAISDLTSIMQFEIDSRFQNFHPLFHYDVKPMAEFKAL
jgi:hypothetical protein